VIAAIFIAVWDIFYEMRQAPQDDAATRR